MAAEKSSARSREATPTPALKRRPARKDNLELALTEAPQAELPLSAAESLEQLWLAIHLPALPLEALIETTEAAAVFEEQQGVARILLANRAARSAGIVPGLTINAALALTPDLRVEERNPIREARVLRELAEWTGKFTSLTSIDPPCLLLIEIAGSLTLFGGLKALRQRIVRGLDSQGFSAGISIAPTPLAATWLARAGQRACVQDPRNLVGKLAPLPVHCLEWPETLATLLNGMGVTTIGELLRLPRAGLAKRFGAMRLLELDRALGRVPDPRVSYRSPEHFIADYDLNEEQDDAGLLLNVCRELLVRLERFLLHRQMAVQHIGFSFFHLKMPATELSLGCVQADRVAGHWLDLLEIKFEALALPAPVIAVRLCGGRGQSFTASTALLPFRSGQRQRPRTSIAHLAERLAARIGDDAVQGVMAVAEHRPHYAWQRCNHFDDVPHCARAPTWGMNPHAPELLVEIRQTGSLVLRRPLWMLDKPERLETDREGRPRYQGPLTVVSGPERLETGWWDDDGIARDYFVVVNPQGVHLWIYRDRGRERYWYVHGKFG